jgi:hypothetical protein
MGGLVGVVILRNEGSVTLARDTAAGSIRDPQCRLAPDGCRRASEVLRRHNIDAQ